MRDIIQATICFALLLCVCAYGQARTVAGGGVTAGEGTTDYTDDANCMGAWLMNSEGNETDQSGEGGTLTETSGEIARSATVPSGYSGYSRGDFDTNTAGLEHGDGNSTDISGTALSIVAWIKLNASVSGIIVNKYTSTSGRQYQLVYRSDNDAICGYIGYNSGNSYCKAIGGTNTVDDDSWHHVAMTFDGSDIKIYLDGDVDSNGADNPKSCSQSIYDGTYDFCVGARDSVADNWDGLLDEVAIFNKVLTENEIEDIMANGIDGSKGGND